MFDFIGKDPDKSSLHSDDCRIFKVDPTVRIQWPEIRRGVWEAICVCGIQCHYEPIADTRVRLDPYDPSTSRHMPQCEHRDTTDPALIRAILRVRDGAGGGYWVRNAASATRCGRSRILPSRAWSDDAFFPAPRET
jgi:hypothetical protein